MNRRPPTTAAFREGPRSPDAGPEAYGDEEVLPAPASPPADSARPDSPTKLFHSASGNAIVTRLASHTALSASYPSTSDSTNYFITPAIGRHRFVVAAERAAQSAGPKKSILKRSTGAEFGRTGENVAFESNTPRYTSRLLQFPSRANVELTKLRSVGFSEKNTVAIFGDTSDDNTTENESERLAAAAAVVAAANHNMHAVVAAGAAEDVTSGSSSRIPVPVMASALARNAMHPIRQTSILYSEDEDTDSPSQPMADSHEGTPFDDTPTEELEDLQPHPANGAKLGAPNGATDDGEVSYASSGASSLVTSKWWFGKDMRYVTHCDKKGCNHKHHAIPSKDHAGVYLTPTQVKSKEISRLRKELKTATTLVDEKERHLRELRERVKEIEALMDTNAALKEHTRLMQRQRDLQEEHRLEKQMLVEKHEVRVRQLIQEAVDARAEALKKAEQLEQFYVLRRQNLVDAGTNTDAPAPAPAPTTITPALTGSNAQLALISPSGDASSPAPVADPQVVLTQETVHQLQAYQNEALIWRTKAAQLELVVKEQLAKAAGTESQLANELETQKAENEKLREYIFRLETSTLANSMFDGDRAETAALIRSMDSCAPGQVVARSPSLGLVLTADCQNPICLERTRVLTEENKELLDTLESSSTQTRELEGAVCQLRASGEDMALEIEDFKVQHQKLAALAEERNSECQAAQLVLARLQSEKEQLGRALSFLEERVKVYRNTILDHDLVVADEVSDDWHRGFTDPRYAVLLSKTAQTDLTSDALNEHERDFCDLREKLRSVQAEFSSQHQSLHDKFSEIEENLILKTNLVESLSRQVDTAHTDVQTSHEQRQRERELYQQRIDALAKVAERVSFLEAEHERMKQEKSQLERRFDEVKQDYEEGLETALDSTLKKYKEQTLYWQDRVTKLEQSRNLARSENDRLRKDYELLRMKNALDKADLEHRLTSSIDHVSTLHSQLNIPRRDAQVDAHPKTANKYVSCKPNTRAKETCIQKGDLFDEVEERLKLSQTELAITRRQVQVLQQKMFEGGPGSDHDTPRPSPFYESESLGTSSPTRTLDRNSSLKVTSVGESSQGEAVDVEDLKENITQLEERNVELCAKLRQSEAERHEQIKAERERIQHLVLEFDNVRRELDEEIGKYEREKVKLKDRIVRLEKHKVDADHLKAKIKQWDRLQRLLGNETAGRASESNEDSDLERPVDMQRSEVLESASGAESDPGVRRSVSFPTLLVTGVDSDSEPEQQLLLLNELPQKLLRQPEHLDNAAVAEELARLKTKVEQSIRRTVSHHSHSSAEGQSLSVPTTRSEASPAFAEFSTDLSQVQEELERLLSSMETPVPRRVSFKREEAVVSEIVLESELEVFDREQSQLRAELTEVRSAFEEANRELELYRSETAAAVRDRKADPRFKRCGSSENLVSCSVTPQELQRWKETAGTTFREVNRLRRDFAHADKDRRDLRTQVAILRGEIELAKAQNQLNHEQTLPQSLRSIQYQQQQHRRSSLQFKPCRSSVSPTTGSYATAVASLPSLTAGIEAANEAHSLPSPESWRSALEDVGGSCAASTTELVAGLQQQLKVVAERNQVLERQLVKMRLTQPPLSRSQETLPVAGAASMGVQPTKVQILEREVTLYEKKVREMEEERQQMYLVMFKKGQQAARHDIDEDKRIDEMTEDKVVLRFLHDAFYYYLLNRGNTREHLTAIMTMLNFTSAQKDEVCRRRGGSH